jgi:hypothetical protein
MMFFGCEFKFSAHDRSGLIVRIKETSKFGYDELRYVYSLRYDICTHILTLHSRGVAWLAINLPKTDEEKKVCLNFMKKVHSQPVILRNGRRSGIA